MPGLAPGFPSRSLTYGMVIMRAARSVAGIVGLGLVAAACTGGGNGGGGGDGASGLAGAATARCLLDPDAPVEEVNAIPTDAASALDDPDDASFPEPLVETDCILSGGPPPDGIVGPPTGAGLDPAPADILSWEEWREANPAGRGLTRDPGHDRRYGENP